MKEIIKYFWFRWNLKFNKEFKTKFNRRKKLASHGRFVGWLRYSINISKSNKMSDMFKNCKSFDNTIPGWEIPEAIDETKLKNYKSKQP